MAVDNRKYYFWSLTFFLPITFTQQAMILAGGILILAAECLNTAIERIVDDISNKKRPAAKHAKDAGSAAVAITAIATGVVWLVTIFDLLSPNSLKLYFLFYVI